MLWYKAPYHSPCILFVPLAHEEILGQHQKHKIHIQQNKKQESSQEISQEFLKELEQDIEMIHNVDLQFSIHKDTGRTMVTVMNKDNGQTIREIPPKEILDLAEKLNDMIGILFDKTI